MRSGFWGYVLVLLGAAALASAPVALVYGERLELWYFLGLGVFGAAAGGFWARRGRTPSLTPRDGLPYVAAGYLLFSLLAAIPFLGVSGFLDGWFEALSGITTTGLSVFVPEELPRSLLLFRSLCQWIGGAGIVLISLVFLLPPGRSALYLYSAERGKENPFGNIRLTARRIAAVYAGLTLLGYGVYILSGMGPFDGLVHVLSTVSTGGFSPFSDSIGHYRSGGVEAAVSAFMFLGATSFPLIWVALHPGGWREVVFQRELWLLFIVPLLLGGVIAWATGSFGAGIFQGISAVTTTGFATVPPERFSPLSRWALILGMVIGGMGGSTAGGIKLFRLVGLLAFLGWLLGKARLPGNAQVPFKALGNAFSGEEISELSGYILLYLVVLAGATSALVAMGYPLADSLFEAASAQGTVGLSVGIARPGAPAGAKLVLMLLMLMGRLEIIPVILLLRKAVRRR